MIASENLPAPANNLAGNVGKLYTMKVLRWFMLFVPVMVPFFRSNGLSMTQIMLLQSVFSVMVVLLEVPSGYFADAIGRKQSLVIGMACCFVGLCVYSLSAGFWGFLFGELVLGLGSSFISGADSALLYDTLLASGKDEEYKTFEGRHQALGNYSEGVAGVAGGLLAAASLRLPLYVQTALMVPAVLVALSLREPTVHAGIRKKTTVADILSVVKYALHEQKALKWLIIYSSIISTSTLTMAWFAQPYFTHVGLPLALFGVVWAALQFSAGSFSLAAHRIENVLGRQRTLISLVVLVGLGYVALSLVNALWGIAIIVVFYYVRGINFPVMGDYVNRCTPSSMRATVLSINALLSRLIFAAVGPLAGRLTDEGSISLAFRACAVGFTSAGVISLIFLAKSGGLRCHAGVPTLESES